MKKLLPILALLISSTAFAQRAMQDVFYLKNGSVLRGQQLINTTDDKLSIELQGGSIFVFAKEEVDSVTHENANKAQLKLIKNNYYRRNRGYRNMTELGIIYGTNLKQEETDPYNYYGTNGDDIGMSLHTVNGYQWWPYLYTGVGMGIDRYISYKQSFSPFYVRLASEFLKKRVTPYVFLDGGYALMWKQKSTDYVSYQNKGGLYLSAGAGVRIYTNSRASVLLSASYKRTVSQTRWQYTYYENDGTYYTIDRTYQRLSINLGVSF